MLTRARLYELVDYEAYNRFDTSVFNFQVPGQPARPVGTK
jgi:methylisocitrate lyase